MCRRGKARVDTARWGARLSSRPRRVTPRDSLARDLPGPGSYLPVAEARPRSQPVPRPPHGAPPASCGPGPRPRPRRRASVYLRPGSRRCRLPSLPPQLRCSPTAPGEPPPAHRHARTPGRDPDLGECGPGTGVGTHFRISSYLPSTITGFTKVLQKTICFHGRIARLLCPFFHVS